MYHNTAHRTPPTSMMMDGRRKQKKKLQKSKKLKTKNAKMNLLLYRLQCATNKNFIFVQAVVYLNTTLMLYRLLL